MEVFSYLAIFLLIRRLQKFVKISQLYIKWHSQLTIAMWATIAVYILSVCYLDELVQTFLAGALLTGVVVYADKETDFVSLRAFFRAHYPLIGAVFLAALVQLIKPDFFEKYDSRFGFAVIAGFVWIFARQVTSKKQQEEIEVITTQNTELDRLVAERTAELTKQRNELQDTLLLLQTTQQQLIQSEKLASLGELTAGIAHEIQNPLNFVNNFSEVSMELVDEMEEELTKGDKDEAIAIAADIKQNLEKIIHHGKRADGIVKGMLQHSRASNGVKESTNINDLADEYLRLAYHGLRAKDKSFNTELVTHFDPKLPQVNIVPQDIGRVLLNLFTNAFYAVQQKQKTEAADYKPTVTLSTAVVNGNIQIEVKDNGIGIPDEIKEKIMQPFFTTKPTGEGTGLGLSLSYDIIAKAHGGKIKIDSEEGKFTTFTISIPA